ncbi:unnamed protein product [Cercospora beticola]|nr:unnamed protein product [Cercospora beticola]
MPKRAGPLKAVAHNKKAKVSSENASKMDAENPHDNRCLFFELSAELRNEIYELALVKSEEIEITKETFAQPALLRTCRQIRAEAVQIYYSRNEFYTTISRLDASLLRAFGQQQSHEEVWLKRTGVALILNEGSNDAYWPNFLQWMKWYYDDEVTGLACPEDCPGGLCCTLDAAFRIVSELQDLRWKRVSTVLETLKRMKQPENGSSLRWLESSQD